MHHGVDDQTREGNLRPNPEDHPNMRVAPSITEDTRTKANAHVQFQPYPTPS